MTISRRQPRRTRLKEAEAQKPEAEQPVSEATLTLASLVGEEEDTPARTLSIDVSMFLVDTPTFVISDLAIADMFRARRDSQQLMARNPTWTDECAMIVATLAKAHLSPKLSCPIGIFYEMLANTHNAQRAALFATLFNQVQKGFPHLINLGGDVEAAKNA